MIGIYSKIMKTNHAKEPNAIYIYDANKNGILVAIKPINKGEEITIDYLAPFSRTYKQQGYTEQQYLEQRKYMLNDIQIIE